MKFFRGKYWLLIFLMFYSPCSVVGQYIVGEYLWPELIEQTPSGYPLNGKIPAIAIVIEDKVPIARKRWNQMQEETNIVLSSNTTSGNTIFEQPNEWAGMYMMLNTEIGGTLFRWSPQLGFIGLGTEACGGVLTDIKLGRVSFTQSHLQLFPETDLFPKAKSPYMPVHLPLDLIPVKWGGAHYLIAKNELIAFCNNYVAGLGLSKYKYVRPFIKVGDKNSDMLAKPNLPAVYSNLSKKPLVTKVAALRNHQLKRDTASTNARLVTEVILNIGKRSGVKIGMEFILFDLEDDPAVFSNDVEIVSISQDKSIGIFIRYLRDNDPQSLALLRKTKPDYFQTIKIGMKAFIRPIH